MPVENKKGEIEFSFGGTEDRVPLALLEARGLELSLLNLLASALLQKGRERTNERGRSLLNPLVKLLAELELDSAISMSPIRTRPERVYSHPTDAYEPSGQHVPFVLDRMLRSLSTKDSKAIDSALIAFGERSKLFQRVKPKSLGRKPGSPFHLEVSIAGKQRNLVDVGYGVSQALPLVVEASLASQGQWILLQQPEVHLHPRAQAELGSLFVRLAQSGRRVVVETHSDFVIDRIRTEVAEGKISPDKVQVLFLDREGLDTTIHPLKLNARGDMEGAPVSYREFFLQEQLRVLDR